MVQIRFTGYVPGFHGIALIKLLRAITGSGLADSKDISDAILEGKQPIVTVETTSRAELLIAKARELGALAELVPACPDQP